MNREQILEAARQIVTKDREQDYGSPEDNFGIASILWSAYLQFKVDPHDVAVMMILLKVARIASGHQKADNWIDIAGYAACGGELDGKS